MASRLWQRSALLFAGGALAGGTAFYVGHREARLQYTAEFDALEKRFLRALHDVRENYERELAARPAPVEHRALKYGAPSVSSVKVRKGYVAGYNRRMRAPDWVLECVSGTASSDGGERQERQRFEFAEDTSEPPEFRAELRQYAGSGYDRGHLSAAANHAHDAEAMRESFLLSNVAPQVGVGFNRSYWARLEAFVRALARREDVGDVFVVSGPLYAPVKNAGDDDDGKAASRARVEYDTIGATPEHHFADGVAVGSHWFKAILVEDTSGNVKAVGAFVLPNKPIDDDAALEDFSVPLATLERAAGLQPFPGLHVDKPEFGVTKLCQSMGCELPPPGWWKR